MVCRAREGMSQAEFETACRTAGLKITRQRIAVYRAIAADEEGHPDAEKVWRAVAAEVPGVSFDTVYRTLDLLDRHGIVFRVLPHQPRARFEIAGERHHHFFCESCGSIQDVHDARLDGVRVPRNVTRYGRPTGVRVEIRGVCAACGRT